MLRSRRLRVALILGLVLAACSGEAPSPTRSAPASAPAAPSAGASPAALGAARAELDRAVELLERIHPEPFHAVDRTTFVGDMDELKSGLDRLSQDEAAVELMRTWALLARERDGHQFALPLDDELDPILPIRVYEFEEGVFVTDAMAPNEGLVGGRVTEIAGHPIDDVLAAIEPLVPRDGPATVPSFRPMFLLRATVLRGLGLASGGPIPITVQTDDGPVTAELEPVPADRFREWAGWLAFTGLPPREGLRHTLPTDANLSVELIDDGRTAYVRYRQIQQVSQAALDELLRLAALPGVERVVVDIRQNPGGDNFTYPPVVSALSDPRVDRPGRLVLLTDRVTFSAASNFATVVEQGTSAAFAGEPMGGGLNFWNDVDWVELDEYVLPMRVAVSTRYWEKSTPDDTRLSIEPDLAVPATAADYFAGRDALLDAVLAGDVP